MTPGNVIAVGAASGFVVWIAWEGLGRAVWLAARTRRWMDDQQAEKLVRRYGSVTKVRVLNLADYASPVGDAVSERQRCIDAIVEQAEDRGTLDEFAALCADLAPTARDIAALRFFNIDDWTAAA